MASTGPVRRKPGDRNDFATRSDPDVQFLGEQSMDGGGSPLLSVGRLLGAVFTRRTRRKRGL